VAEPGGFGGGDGQQAPGRLTRGWALAVALATIGGVIALLEWLLGAVSALWVWAFPAELEATVGFNTLDRCARGDLAGLKDDLLLPEAVSLPGEAALLSLCDDTPLTATPSALAAALAERYRGCLDYDAIAHELRMEPNEAAVCRHDGARGARFFCLGDRPESRKRPVVSRLVDPTELPECAADVLQRIGATNG